MEIVYLLLPLSVSLALLAVIGYIWASRTGQFDDLDTPAHRILGDEENIKSHESQIKAEKEQGKVL